MEPRCGAPRPENPQGSWARTHARSWPQVDLLFLALFNPYPRHLFPARGALRSDDHRGGSTDHGGLGLELENVRHLPNDRRQKPAPDTGGHHSTERACPST